MPLQQPTSPIKHGDVPGGRHLSADLGIITFESGMFLVLLAAISSTPSKVSGISLIEESARRNSRKEEEGHYQNQTHFLAIHLSLALALAHNRRCDDFYVRQIDKGTQINNAILQPTFKCCRPPLVTITSGPKSLSRLSYASNISRGFISTYLVFFSLFLFNFAL
ncbi:hypothetical protein NC651_013085 [Populus alba x Populus x berolinensis]|nr:hypothetical protein NC651_013085 [Populus alba x Populus x berolinensis]